MTFRQIGMILIRVFFILNSIVNPTSFSMGAEREQVSFIIEILNKFPKLAILYEVLDVFIFNII